MEYSWCEYYRKAYEKERKKNTVLAGQVADAEAKREELQAKYETVCSNPLYRLSRIFSLPAKGFRRIGRTLSVLRQGGGKEEPAEEFLSSYEERLDRQQDRYRQWIKEREPALWEKYLGDLTSERAPERRGCIVVPYGALAGAASLAEIVDGNLPGDILLFAERAEELDERAIPCIEKLFGAYRNIKLFYGAEDHREGETRRMPWFKPCFSPDTLLGFFCFGSYFAVDRAWAEKTPLAGYEDGRQNLYDFVLRLLKPYFGRPGAVRFDRDRTWLTGGIYAGGGLEARAGERSPEVAHADLVLYHRGDEAEFWGYEKEFIKLKQDFINGMGFACFPCRTLHPHVWSIVPEGGTEGRILLSVIIPSKDHPALVENCIRSFLERTYLPGMREKTEFIVVDNGSTAQNRQVIRDFLESTGAVCKYICRQMEFNFSAMCNLGVEEAEGEFILLLNDDIEVIEKNWLRIMLGQALLPGVGAVGAKLWYPEEERIQHAGVTNMHVGPSHKMTTFSDDRTYYYGHNTVSYDMIAVTAACLLVKKSVFEEAGGLDESLAVSYNDVDFCFTLAERGYRNVLRNDAVLLHHESASRGQDGESDEKWQRLLDEKEKLYKKHPLFLKYDPFYSEQLADCALEYRIGYQYPWEKPFLTAKPERQMGKKRLGKILSGTVMLTMERIEDRRPLYQGEPDIREAEGWCYMRGQDNCLFERWLILEPEEGDFYYQIPVAERRRPDVEAVLPLERHIELSGFTCRIQKKDIVSGRYTVGMLYKNLRSKRTAYGRSGRQTAF